MVLSRALLFIFLGGMAYLGADNAPEVQKAVAAPVPPGYVLGPNDQISVDVVELPEFNNKSYRVDNDGTISLPLIGRVHAAGLTLTEFEQTVHDLLQKQVRNPHLVANLVETRSQAVSV